MMRIYTEIEMDGGNDSNVGVAIVEYEKIKFTKNTEKNRILKLMEKCRQGSAWTIFFIAF